RSAMPTPYAFALCPACNTIHDDPSLQLTQVSRPCPACGVPGYRRFWPCLFSQLWMSSIATQRLETEQDRPVLAVMLCSLTELLLEEHLAEILRGQGARPDHIELIL